MLRVEYPRPEFRTRLRPDGVREVFDTVRRAWVRLSPEEWVRQNFIRFLSVVRGYPAAMMAVEREIRLGPLRRKFDILLYDTAHRPWMMVECKAEDVPLTDAVLMQILRYNMALPVPYLVITNGDECHAVRIHDGLAEWIDDWPPYA
jgi:hypothetical protein